jgi:hypothetical protein
LGQRAHYREVVDSNLAVNKMVVLKAGDPLNKGRFFFSKNICEEF